MMLICNFSDLKSVHRRHPLVFFKKLMKIGDSE